MADLPTTLREVARQTDDLPGLRAGDLSAPALAPAHLRRRAEFAAKERVASLLQQLIARRWLAVTVARRLATRPAVLAELMGVIGDFVPARRVLSPAFAARLLLP